MLLPNASDIELQEEKVDEIEDDISMLKENDGLSDENASQLTKQVKFANYWLRMLVLN